MTSYSLGGRYVGGGVRSQWYCKLASGGMLKYGHERLQVQHLSPVPMVFLPYW